MVIFVVLEKRNTTISLFTGNYSFLSASFYFFVVTIFFFKIESIRGNFQKGKEHGQGFLSFADKSEYTGEFLNGDITGKGQYRTKKGAIFAGDFVDGKLSKIGTISYPLEKEFIGNFENNLAQDFGQFKHPKYGKLQGYWTDGSLKALEYNSFKFY